MNEHALFSSKLVRRKSILKRPPSVTPPKITESTEVLMEKAIERTLNFLNPNRRFTARQRALSKAHK